MLLIIRILIRNRKSKYMGRIKGVPGEVSIAGEKARELITKSKGVSQMAMARKLLNDNPLLIKDVEHARALIRWHVGRMKSNGRLNPDPVPFTSHFTRENPYGLPPSHEELRAPFILPKVNNNILVLSDLHIPYHSIDALNVAIKYGLENKVNTIFINGDLLDCHQLSKYEKDPKKRSTVQELTAGKEFLQTLRKLFPKAQMYYHLGNHDIRYERFLNIHKLMFQDLFGDSGMMDLETRLELIKTKVTLIGDKQITHCGITGKLALHHGHYLFRGATSPVSPAKTILDKMSMSMICGHTHKISEYTKTDGRGDILTAWSSGSLAELLPDYAPMANNYAHGFAHARIKDSGDFVVRNFRIKNGKIL